MDVLRLSAEKGNISRARNFVHDVMAASGGAATDDLALATSEIVTNTVLHG